MSDMNLYERMTANPNVKMRETIPGVFACNFTRKAFYKGIWDNETVKARGLFIDRDGNVLARGFEKFFGLDEHNGPTTEEFFENAQFPVRVMSKENGFLVIISSIDGELKFFSKSGETDYSRHAKKYFDSMVDAYTQDTINAVISEMNVSLLVEFVDPYKDPHIVLYDSVEMYLLAVVKNTEKFKVVDPLINELFVRLTWSIGYGGGGLSDPANVRVVDDLADLKKLVDTYKNDPYMDSEGCVLMDANGWMVKVKSDAYKAVKSYRTSINKVLKGEVDEKAQKIMNALAVSNHSLNDYVIEDISGAKVVDIPGLATDLGVDIFMDNK